MKMRCGFVSNSSSSSFTITRDEALGKLINELTNASNERLAQLLNDTIGREENKEYVICDYEEDDA